MHTVKPIDEQAIFNELKKSIGIPLIIAGGSKGLEDFKTAIDNYKIHNT